MNCTDELLVPSKILGDKTAVRVVLWVISTLALVSNLALIVSRVYTHARRQRPLSTFIVGLALSNLFVTTSVLILLVADSHQSSGNDTSPLGQGNWSQSVCSPVYFLKHFGIYSLVIILTCIVLERFTKLGYKLCFTPELSFRRSALYIGEAWVLSFLLIIPPWTRVTTWHMFCMASYEMSFAQAMYIFCGVLALGACFSALVLVGLLFYRRVFTSKSSGTRNTEIRTDIRLILAGVLTFVLLGIPHGAISIAQSSGQESGTEVVTILLSLACLLNPLIFINYSSSAICLTDTLSTKNMECTCGKCNMEQFYPTKYSLDSLNPPKSTDTVTEYHEDYDSRRQRTKVSSVEHMSADSLLDLDTWASRSTKTKSWIESCDYEDLKKLRAQTPKRDNSFREVTSKPRALTWSDRCGGKSTSTSGVNDVSSATSSCSERVSSSSGRARSSSEREPSSSDHTPSTHGVVTKELEVDKRRNEGAAKELEIVTTEHESIATNHDSESEKTTDRKRTSKRLSSFRGLIQRALSPRRQRSKSLPEKPEVYIKKFERSRSAPFTVITVDKTGTLNGNTTENLPESVGPSSTCPHQKTGEHTYMDRLASFFILAPAKSPKHARKPTLSPKKAKVDRVVSPTPSVKSSMAERLVKSFAIGRKSPSHEPASPARTIAQEAGDVLTELPVVRRQKLKPKPRDSMARISTGSTGSTTTRFSLEWDPIGSVEGYDEHEVLPPYPPIKTRNGQPPAKVARPLSEVQAPEQPKVPERTSLYSLDWDPTSVQMRNSFVSRDSLGSLGDCSDDEGHTYNIEDCKGSKGKTVWV